MSTDAYGGALTEDRRASLVSSFVDSAPNQLSVVSAFTDVHAQMVMRETGWLLVIGLIVGVGLASAGIRLIESRLFGLQPTDPVAFTTAIVILAIVAALATWLPAYRASRVDPLVALRYE